MPSTTTTTKEFALHPDYVRYSHDWQKCDDASEGDTAVKLRTTEYVPRLTGMAGDHEGKQEYTAYLLRASWFGATGRTITGLTGTVLRKPPKVEFPDEEFLKTVGSRDQPLLSMLQSTIQSILTMGRVGHLVDAGESEGDENPRPYVTAYRAQDILNWHQEPLDGRLVTVRVVLHEIVHEPSSDKTKVYEMEALEQWRVLRLGTEAAFDVQASIDQKQAVLAEGFTESEAAKPFYFQEIWRKEKDEQGRETGNLVIIKVITPRKVGARLWEEIPFIFSNTSHHLPEVEKPPLLDMVNVNFSHFRDSADLQHGLHFTALPTPYGFGFDPNQKLRIGAGVAWLSPEKDGSVGMLEFTGKGLGLVRETMEDKKREMAVLGSRLLEDQKTGVEAADAIRLRLTSDNSTLTNIAIVVSVSWTKLLKWLHDWTSATESSSIEVLINLDFNPRKLSSDELKTLFLLLQQGGMSWETYYWNLQTGEMIPPGRTREEEEAGIEEGPPESAALGGLGIEQEVPANTSHEDGNTDHEDENTGHKDGNTSHLGDMKRKTS